MAPFLKKSLGRGWPEIREWAPFSRLNFSLSLFSLGRVQEMNLGFMRVQGGKFDVNLALYD